jgi:hypothetical protein
VSFTGIKFEQIFSDLMKYKRLAHIAPIGRRFGPSDADNEADKNDGGKRGGGVGGADKKGEEEGSDRAQEGCPLAEVPAAVRALQAMQGEEVAAVMRT